jgi:hypothetical protein
LGRIFVPAIYCGVETRQYNKLPIERRYPAACGGVRHPYRVNPKREFFEIDPEQAIVILRLFSKKDITPAIAAEIDKSVSTAEKEASENYKKKRPPLNFVQMGIPIGAKLVFTYSDIAAEAYVSSDRKVTNLFITKYT